MRKETLRWQISQLAQLTSYADCGYVNKSGRYSCDSSLSAFSVHNESKTQILILLRINSIITEPMAR